MSTAQRPLPCPFCGHVGLTFGDGSTYRWGIASCAGCDASAGETRREYPDIGAWHQMAIEQWNRRDSELLSALQSIVTRYEYDGIPGDSQEAVNAARAAIAKATTPAADGGVTR